MVNVNCSGGQDRNTTTSETHPYIPPQKTNVQFAPCQNPLTVNIIKTLNNVLYIAHLLPPKGMYK